MPSKPFQDLTKNKLKGFTGAEIVLRSPNQWLILARWNHSQAVGWYLYLKERSTTAHKFHAFAGRESLVWTRREAVKWARSFLKGA